MSGRVTSGTLRTLTEQIDDMRKQGHYFDTVTLSTMLAWSGEQMAMVREIEGLKNAQMAMQLEIQGLRKANDDLARRLRMDTGA